MRFYVVATVIGNGLEWYDFTVYGIFAVTISTQFFPAAAGNAAIFSTLAIFGVAYLFRPLGGIVFGHYADVVGRRRVLIALIATMTVGMALLTFAPTYAMAGIAAPIILLLARIIQGFSVGGEFATGTVFLVEHAPPGRRGLYGAFQFFSQAFAGTLGGVVGLIITHTLGPEALQSWGWRIPFLLGLVVGPLALYLRRTLEETPEFARQLDARTSAPIVDAFARFKGRMLSCFFMTLGGTASFYVLFIVMPAYAIRTLHLGITASFVAPLAGGVTQMISAPIGGALVDRFGRRGPVVGSVALLTVLVLPAFTWLAAAPSIGRMVALEIVLSFMLGIYGGSIATAMADLFPVGVRTTGMTISYNVGIGVFGGFAPLVIAWMIAVTKSPLAPAYYDLAGLVCALIAVLLLPRAWAAQNAPA